MRRTAIILFLVIGVAVIGGWAVTAQAQNVSPVPIDPLGCYIAAHDMNRDGKVNEADFNLWKTWLFKSGGECGLEAPAGACPAGMDINGDGVITFDDLNIMLERYRVCIMAPRANTEPQG